MPKGIHHHHVRSSRHGRWNSGRIVSTHGYAKVRVGIGHPLADSHGYAYEHLLVWVAAGNARPKPGEVIKWRDGDRLNNRIENLYVTTRSASNRQTNAARGRDPRGRLLAGPVARAVRGGAQLTQHFMKVE